ncbi:hypothetical protein Tsubulata_050050, partial [Turnera subulata]
MFSGCVVGLANGVAAGWANMGALLLSCSCHKFNFPYIPEPTYIHSLAPLVSCSCNLSTSNSYYGLGQDLPSGDYRDSKRSVKNEKHNFLPVLLNGLTTGVWCESSSCGYNCCKFWVGELFLKANGRGEVRNQRKTVGAVGGADSSWVAVCAAWAHQLPVGRRSMMCAFSVFVQAASGLTFGVVPFVSKRSLGVIAGMTGSGGTVGAVVAQLLLFTGSGFSRQTSISLMGLMIIFCTLPVTLIYFPQWGGMFCGPSSDSNPTDEDVDQDSNVFHITHHVSYFMLQP